MRLGYRKILVADKKCMYCGKYYSKPKKLSYKAFMVKKYCSAKCMYKAIKPPSRKGTITSMEVKKKMSESHKKLIQWNYKGGITPETNKRIADYLWRDLRKKIYARDNWHCQICKKHCHNDIQCHHIIPYRITQDNSEGNLITLCKSCHIKEERKYYNTKQMELNFGEKI